MFALIAEAYQHDEDLPRARGRLAALGVREPAAEVAAEADAAFLRGDAPASVRALAALAEALGAEPMARGVFPAEDELTRSAQPTVAGGSTRATATAAPTPTEPRPTATAVPTFVPATPTAPAPPQSALTLSQRDVVCEADSTGQIEVWAYDEFGMGIPAVEVRVEWDGGQDVFYTGLKPSIDPGYADYTMQPDRIYRVTLVGRGEPVLGLDSAPCLTLAGDEVTPTIRLIFTPANTEPPALP